MVALSKARDIEAFLAKPQFDRKIILFFGPDDGLVTERADDLAKKCDVDLSDPFSVIRLDADDVAADPARLADEAHTINMFGGGRLIRISGTTRRDLSKSLKPVLATPPEDSIILIEAGDLKKSSALRKSVEASKNALGIPCYQDDAAALDRLIDQEIVAAGLSMDHDTRTELRALLGDNRRVSRGELTKLALYCSDQKSVQLHHVREIVGDASKLVIDDVIDAVIIGDAEQLQLTLPKAFEANYSPDVIIMTALRQFQILHRARANVEQNRQSVSTVIGSLRPPLHFSRKNAVSRAISTWTLERLTRALGRLNTAMLDCRRLSETAPSLAGTTLLALCLEARALGNRR